MHGSQATNTLPGHVVPLKKEKLKGVKSMVVGWEGLFNPFKKGKPGRKVQRAKR